jgi:ureidoglycolate dehydrogenase (NAD+)
MNQPAKSLDPTVLKNWVSALLQARGLLANDANQTAGQLVQTSLWGIDSHGIARLPHYLNRLGRKSIIAVPKMTFEATGSATGNVDGGHGLGFLACTFAMTHAVQLAKISGAGVVGIRNSSHCGAIGLYSRQAAQNGMIGIVFTHSDSFVVPHGGKKAFFGTNPISIAVPSDDTKRPLCVDMATSITTLNRIMNARRENQLIPEGLGVDQSGNDTTNPHKVAALKPMAGPKGYALAFLIDMLCGPLNAMPFGPHLNNMYTELDQHRELGSLVIAIDPSRFFGGAQLAATIVRAIAEVKSQAEGVLYPGEPEYLTEAARLKTGIPIEATLWRELTEYSTQLAIPIP